MKLRPNVADLCVEHGRDALFIAFPNVTAQMDRPEITEFTAHPVVKETLEWFKTQDLEVEIADVPYGTVNVHYMQQCIFVNVPFLLSDPLYQLLAKKFEHPDGTMRDPRVAFYALKLEDAHEYLSVYSRLAH